MAWGDKHYQTWINHALIAAAGTFVFSLWLPIETAALLMPWAYAFREGEQQMKKWQKEKPIDVLDAMMDVIAPVLAAAAVWWWLT